MSRVDYTEGFRTIQILPEWEDDVSDAIDRVLERRDTYESIERDTGIAWPYVAAIHYRESTCNFTRQILNGEPYNQQTSLVPKGHGPWQTWKQSAIHALRLKHRPGTFDDDVHIVDNMLKNLEAWNGWGYAKKDINSPYLWTGSQYGKDVGKYVADGNYSATAQDKQVGAAVLVHELMARGYWSPQTRLYTLPILVDKEGQYISNRARKFQVALNIALEDTLIPPLVEDGWIGPKTALAFEALVDLSLHGVED